MTTVATGGRLVEPAPSAPADERAGPPPVDRPRRFFTRETLVALLFLLPALVLLGALVVYPIGYTIVRSFFDRAGAERENFKLVGFVPAGEFRAHVEQLAAL